MLTDAQHLPMKSLKHNKHIKQMLCVEKLEYSSRDQIGYFRCCWRKRNFCTIFSFFVHTVVFLKLD